MPNYVENIINISAKTEDIQKLKDFATYEAFPHKGSKIVDFSFLPFMLEKAVSDIDTFESLLASIDTSGSDITKNLLFDFNRHDPLLQRTILESVKMSNKPKGLLDIHEHLKTYLPQVIEGLQMFVSMPDLEPGDNDSVDNANKAITNNIFASYGSPRMAYSDEPSEITEYKPGISQMTIRFPTAYVSASQSMLIIAEHLSNLNVDFNMDIDYFGDQSDFRGNAFIESSDKIQPNTNKKFTFNDDSWDTYDLSVGDDSSLEEFSNHIKSYFFQDHGTLTDSEIESIYKKSLDGEWSEIVDYSAPESVKAQGYISVFKPTTQHLEANARNGDIDSMRLLSEHYSHQTELSPSFALKESAEWELNHKLSKKHTTAINNCLDSDCFINIIKSIEEDRSDRYESTNFNFVYDRLIDRAVYFGIENIDSTTQPSESVSELLRMGAALNKPVKHSGIDSGITELLTALKNEVDNDIESLPSSSPK